MLLFYFMIFCLLLTAVLVIAIPFGRQIFSKEFFLISIFMIVFSVVLYGMIGDSKGLQQWLMTGRNHYELLTQVERLGGIDGLITRLENKLAENPEDSKGWNILAKLYLAKGDQENAERALMKAKK